MGFSVVCKSERQSQQIWKCWQTAPTPKQSLLKVFLLAFFRSNVITSHGQVLKLLQKPWWMKLSDLHGDWANSRCGQRFWKQVVREVSTNPMFSESQSVPKQQSWGLQNQNNELKDSVELGGTAKRGWFSVGRSIRATSFNFISTVNIKKNKHIF